MPTHELTPIRYTHNLKNRVNHVRQLPNTPVVAGPMEREDFINALFGDVEADELYVSRISRPPGGLGPDFDAYEEHLDADFPFVASYNSWGRATLFATLLAEDLRQCSNERSANNVFLEREYRKDFSRIAMIDARSDTEYPLHTCDLSEGMAVITPQIGGELSTVYEIKPPLWQALANQVFSSGEILKLLVPKKESKSMDTVINDGFETYAEYLEREAHIEKINKARDVINITTAQKSKKRR